MTGDLVIFLYKLIQRQISNKSKTCFRSTKVERNLVRFSKPLWEISRGTWQIQPGIKIWINIGLWSSLGFSFFPFLFFCVFSFWVFSTSFSSFSSFDFPLTAPVVHACCCPPCFSIDKVTFLPAPALHRHPPSSPLWFLSNPFRFSRITPSLTCIVDVFSPTLQPSYILYILEWCKI